MDKAKVMDVFKDDKRFDGDKIWRRVFRNLEPDEGYDVLKASFGDEDVTRFPDSEKPKFPGSAFDKFTDALAEKIATFKDIDEASEDLEFDIDLDVLDKLEPTVIEINDKNMVDSADAKIVKEVNELKEAIENNDDWKGVLNGDFSVFIEGLKEFVDTWEVD